MSKSVAYTRLSKRISALMIDSVFLTIAAFMTIFSVKLLRIESEHYESIVILLIIASIEPLFISMTGASLGHHLNGMKVRRSSIDKKLNLFLSYLRFFTKLPLGMLSLVSILTTKKYQALHDLISRSIVVHKNPHKVHQYDALPERKEDTEKYIYPSKIYRIFLILVYIIATHIFLALGLYILLSRPCIEWNSCSILDTIIESIFSITSWVITFVAIWLGWQGRLWGGRKKELKS